LQYRSHLEACYCIAGEGDVEDMQGDVYPLRPGSFHILNKHDERYLRGSPMKDLVLVSVFRWTELHPRHHHVFDLDIFLHAVMGAFAAEA